MRKVSSKTLLLLALLFSLATALLIYNYLDKVAKQTSGRQGVPVVVAAVDITPKAKITAEMVRVVQVPPEYIQPGAVQDVNRIIGIVAREQIATGEQITQRRLLIDGKSAGFSGIIPQDKRAVTIAVNEVTGVGGFVKPGDSVDILVTFDNNVLGENASQIFMQNIRVLAVSRDTEPGVADTGDAKKEPVKLATVTLAVSPEEAARLTVADEKGKLRLLLRPFLPGDSPKETSPATPKTVISGFASPPAPVVRQEGRAAAAPTKGIQVIRGTKQEQIPVQ